MSHLHRIDRVSISTRSTAPLRGIVEIDSADATIRFELNEEIALQICADLERFLTQRQPAASVVGYSQR
jgi:hypothetical protein